MLRSEVQSGNKGAMLRLSDCYAKGIYVPMDDSKSQQLSEQAKENSH
jgi:hypothetical protein